MRGIWSLITILTAAAAGMLVGYFLFALAPVSESASKKIIEVKKGEGFGEIAVQLEKSGVVKSSVVFKTYAALAGVAHLLKPGVYTLNTASTTPEIINQLAYAVGQEIKVLIPEGVSLKEIDRRLSELDIIPKGSLVNFDIEKVKSDYEFLISASRLEGYLAPDTYKFRKYSNPIDVVERFLNNFNEKIWSLVKNKTILAGENRLTSKEIIIAASMIEKEVPITADGGERKKIAGILYKRLSIGMPLQIDATVLYVKCGEALDECDALFVSKNDLTIKSPFNTYLNKGLPPAPISNFGVDAISAALNPELSNYLYYLSDPETKKTIFSKTLDEHNQNRVKYLNI